MQNDIIFLTAEEVLEIHDEVIEKFGGRQGVNEHLFLSALGEPQQTFDKKYLHETIYEMAAVYVYSFSKNHAFIDGNKRVALKACVIFLNKNKIDLIFTNNEFEKLILDCIANLINKEEIAKMIKDNAIDWN